MKVHIKFITLIMCAILVINNIIFCSTVYAAAAAGSTVGITALPATTQNEFYSILENILKSLFDTSSSRTITVTGEDGKQYTYDFNSVFDIIQAKIDGNYDIANAELGASYPEVPDDVTFSIDAAFLNSLPAGLKILLAPTFDQVIRLYNKSTAHTSSEGGSHGGAGRRRLSASDYASAVSDILSEINSLGGASAGVSLGIELINGVPHNAVTVNQDVSIEIFDYFGLNYEIFSDITSISFDAYVSPYSNYSDPVFSRYYTPFFVTEDNTLYVLNGSFRFGASSSVSSKYLTPYFYFYSSSTIGSASTKNYSISRFEAYKYHVGFGLYNSGLSICPVLYTSSSYYSSLYRYQYLYSSDSTVSAPIMFSDDLSLLGCDSNTKVTNYFNSVLTSTSPCFYNRADGTTLSYSDLLNSSIVTCGYFYGSSSEVNPCSSNLETLAQALLTSDSLVISGGSSSTTSPLSDWQKAIYILAQQYGESYEELLEKLDMIIDSEGNVTIVGADGIEYKVDELSKTFDEIYSKVDDIASSTSELLEYLKSLNIEGLGSHIAALEGTLNDLNERDKERDAVYDDMLGKLEELNNLVGSLNLDDLKSISTDISDIKDLINDGIKVGEIDIDDIQNNIETSFFIEKFPFSLPFDLYRLITLFVRDPVEPVFKVPIKTEITAFGLNESIDEEITLDLTMFKINGEDIVRVVLNFSIIVGFIVMLIKSTTKLLV